MLFLTGLLFTFGLIICSIIVFCCLCGSSLSLFSTLFFWHNRLKYFDLYVQSWFELRSLINETKKNNNESLNRLLNNLYYYDLSLGYISTFYGLISIFYFNLIYINLNQGNGTENNHNLFQFYIKRVNINKLKNVSNPSKWNFKSLKSSAVPLFKDNDYNIEYIRNILENNININDIRKEYYNVINFQKLVKHPDSKTEVIKGGEWDWCYLYGIGGLNKNVENICPKTFNIINNIELLNKTFGFVFFSVVKKNTIIATHCGSTNLRWRIQLCIDYDENDEKDILSNYLYVGNEKLYWKNGKCLIFDDSYYHGIKYNGNNERVVLIVDIWNPHITKMERQFLSSNVIANFGKINVIKSLD